MSSSPRHIAIRESKSDVSQKSLESPIEAQGSGDSILQSSCNASDQVKERARVHRIDRQIEKLEEQTAGMGAFLSSFGKKEGRSRTRAAREKRKWIEVVCSDGRKYRYLPEHLEAAKRFKTVEEIEEAKRKIIARLEKKIANLTKVMKARKEFFR